MPSLRIGLGIDCCQSAAAPVIFKNLVTSVTCLQAVQSDLGITLNGSTVSAWADQSGNGKDYSQSNSSKQPAYSATALNGFPTLTFDGVSQNMTSSLNLPAPGTTPTFIWWVGRTKAWGSGKRYFGDTSNGSRIIVYMTGVTPAVVQFNGTNANSNTGAAVGSWVRGEAWLNNAVSDYFKLGSTSQTGTSAGNSTAATGREIGSSAGSNFGNIEIAALMYFSGKPSAEELAALSAAVTAKYGASVGV